MTQKIILRRSAIALPLVAVVTAFAFGCDDPVAPELEPQDRNELLGIGIGLPGRPPPPPAGTNLVECPIDETSSTSAIIGLLGGTLTLNGHKVEIPLFALSAPTLITLTEPASQFMEIEVTAGGLESFVFTLPIRITISYRRCADEAVEGSLTVWEIDPDTKELLEHMGGTDDPVARAISFKTGHLSGFAIAN